MEAERRHLQSKGRIDVGIGRKTGSSAKPFRDKLVILPSLNRNWSRRPNSQARVGRQTRSTDRSRRGFLKLEKVFFRRQNSTILATNSPSKLYIELDSVKSLHSEYKVMSRKGKQQMTGAQMKIPELLSALEKVQKREGWP
jgi:hypothetical protein